NRLDLMNRRGLVVDSWRKIEVNASALKAGLELRATANVATKPDSTNPVDFRASASQYTVGFAFDGPLDRLAQREEDLGSLVVVKQARRSFMTLDDQIQAQIRQDIRSLELERRNFKIAQQSLISAASNLEFAQYPLQHPERGAEDTAATRNVLDQLNALLQ